MSCCNTRTYISTGKLFSFVSYFDTFHFFPKFCHFLVDKFIISWRGQHTKIYIRDSRHARLSTKKKECSREKIPSTQKNFLSFFFRSGSNSDLPSRVAFGCVTSKSYLRPAALWLVRYLVYIRMHYGVVFFLVPFRLTKNLLDWFLLCMIVVVVVYAQWEEEKEVLDD